MADPKESHSEVEDTFNFPPKSVSTHRKWLLSDAKVAFKILGQVCDDENKVKGFGKRNTRSVASQKHQKFSNAVKASLLGDGTVLKSCKDLKMHIGILQGAWILAHIDACRGNAPLHSLSLHSRKG